MFGTVYLKCKGNKILNKFKSLIKIWLGNLYMIGCSLLLNYFFIILVGVSHAFGLFLFPLRTSENQRFSDVLRQCKKKQVAWNAIYHFLHKYKTTRFLKFNKDYRKYKCGHLIVGTLNQLFIKDSSTETKFPKK